MKLVTLNMSHCQLIHKWLNDEYLLEKIGILPQSVLDVERLVKDWIENKSSVVFMIEHHKE